MILGIPVLNLPDMLRACLASIDTDVRLVVIDNSGTGELGDVAAEFGALVVEPAANLGYTASVNHIIRSFPREDAWLIANADVVFAPGDMDRLIAEPGGWVGITDWRVFKLTSDTVERVGFWDENFYNYCSDADYERRCDMAGVDRHFIDGETSHVGSVVIRSEARFANANTVSYPRERSYYDAKWGGGLRGGETFTTPFQRGGSLAEWTLDLAHLRGVVW